MKCLSILTAVFLISSNAAFAKLILLSEVMSREEQKKTGVYNLTANQKDALQDWLNANFILKSDVEKPTEGAETTQQKLYLSQNLENGKILRLTDDSEYLVQPEDVAYSAFWITPFPLRVEPSDDPDYPLRIVNINNGQSVRVQQIKPPRKSMAPSTTPSTPSTTPSTPSNMPSTPSNPP